MKYLQYLAFVLTVIICTSLTCGNLFYFATDLSAKLPTTQEPSAIYPYNYYALFYLVPVLIYSIVTAFAAKQFFEKFNYLIPSTIAYLIVAESIWSIIPDVYIISSAIIVSFAGYPIALKILAKKKNILAKSTYVSAETEAAI